MNSSIIVEMTKLLINAYHSGKLRNTIMPEDTHPTFKTQEEKLVYYTLPMALNYQRNSYKLWEAAKATWEDKLTNKVFQINNKLTKNELRECLLKHKLALQPNKHIDTWDRISKTIYENYGDFSNLIQESNNDYLQLKEILQTKLKKGFPYLSGPKIFNYWSYILTQYCDVKLKNRNYIEIAPDTHVIQASVKLGVITKEEADKLSREKISDIWRKVLKDSKIDPIDVHSPLWFWSRGGFKIDI